MTDVFNSYRELKIERRERGVLLITLNRPAVLNAMTYAMHAELARIWTDVDRDPQARVAVVTGAGRAFCAGNDLRNPDPDFDGVREIMRDAVAIVRGMIECDKPIISAVNGYAMGLGANVALLCDVVVAGPSAVFADTHVNMGIGAGDGGQLIWPFLIGVNKAKYYLMTGDRVKGKEALDLIGQHRYDLVFCDLRMPEMDGQQLYEEVQRDYPQVLKRIVFVTAQAHSSDYGPFLRTTGIPVIEKPFTLSQLRQMVGKMVGPNR